MNLIGKILVVIILVASLTFMTMAINVYSTHKDWWLLVENSDPSKGPIGLRLQVQELQQQRTQLQEQVTRLEEETAAKLAERQNALVQAEEQYNQLRREYADLQTELETHVDQERQAVASLASAHDTLAKLRDEVNTLRGEVHDAIESRDEHFQEMVRLTDELNTAEDEKRLADTRNIQLAEQVARIKPLLEKHGINEFEPADGPPRLYGKVLAVNDRDLVEISVGTDDGLAKGHTLEVYRRDANRSTYLGRIEVMRVEPDRAVAKVIPEYRKGIIREEDRVATRLN